MAKIGLKKAVQATEKKVYFSSVYSFSKVAKMAVGHRRYFMFLNPEENFYSFLGHELKAKGPEKGFKGLFNTFIKCKGFDDNNEKIEGDKPLCCELYDKEKEKYPAKEDSTKRMMGWAKPKYIVPTVMLGHNLKDPKAISYPVTNVQISNGYEFLALELSQSAWTSDIYPGVAKLLKDQGVIDYELEGDELQNAVVENLGKILIEVEAVEGKSKDIKYTKKYTFIHFGDARIAKLTGEYNKITEWQTAPEMEDFRNDVAEFTTLLEQNQNEFVKDWTDEELKNYVVDSEQRKANIEAYHASMQQQAKQEEVQLVPTQTIPQVAPQIVPTQTIPQTTIMPQVEDFEVDEADFEFGGDDEEFIVD
jgi:hypothetical protein